MAALFWLNDKQWAALRPPVPRNRPGVTPRRNRDVISGILHILEMGCRWRYHPPAQGPHTTVYNRLNRWSKRGLW